MYGAVLGDIIGAPYEFGRGRKTKDFPLFSRYSRFTDDTVMTIAVAEALMNDLDIAECMQKWGRKYPDAGYGGMFRHWLKEENPQPYGSFGNGSAMRVSSVGWLYDTLEETRNMAIVSAVVTHNHPEGIKGAESIASAIYMARNGRSKEEIKAYIESEFHYDLDRTLEEIRPGYGMDATCQKSVPESIICFLEGTDYEDTVRNAVSLGGDTDTMACIAGGIAEAYWGMSDELVSECRKRLPEDMLKVLDQFVRLKK